MLLFVLFFYRIHSVIPIDIALEFLYNEFRGIWKRIPYILFLLVVKWIILRHGTTLHLVNKSKTQACTVGVDESSYREAVSRR